MADFKLPELGEGIEEADVIKVLVSVGDTVEAGQALMEIETEKATLEVPAETSGVVTNIPVKEGDTIKVGQIIATIEPEGAAEEAGPKAEEETEAEEEAPPAEEEPEEAPPAEEPEREEAEEEREPEEEPERARAEEERRPAEEPAKKEAPARAAAPAVERAPAEGAVFASPAVRKFAREIGVDLRTLKGSGPGGRITDEDVKRASRERPAPPAAPSPDGGRAAPEFRPLPDFAQWGPVKREPVSRLRRTVARNMTQSWTEIPHVHLQHHADITAMEELRQRYKDRARRAGGNLTISVMMLRVVASALRAHPRVNSSYDPEAQELILKDYVHIGVAVDTDRGLVVPKIENVDEKNIIELSVELNGIAERARTNDLTLEEMRGSTFTITNLGSLGTGYFDPIINWPEVGVLGLGRAEQRAVWDEQRREFVPKLIMPLSFAHDHRVLDGADGARFMTWIVEAIRNPLLMALEG
jgi:pyruvate dehydrogenase E2 component (dihydrolipoamide acetyltransferase)